MMHPPKTLADLQLELEQFAKTLNIDLKESKLSEFYASTRNACWDKRRAISTFASIAVVATCIATICYLVIRALENYHQVKDTCPTYNGTMSTIPCSGQNTTDFIQQCCHINTTICESLIEDDMDAGCAYGAAAGLLFLATLGIVLPSIFCLFITRRKENNYTAIPDLNPVATILNSVSTIILTPTQKGQFEKILGDIAANIPNGLEQNPTIQKLSQLSTQTTLAVNNSIPLATLKDIYQTLSAANKLITSSSVNRNSVNYDGRQLNINTAANDAAASGGNKCGALLKNCFNAS